MIDQKRIVPDNYQVLIPEEKIQGRLREMGEEISREFANDKPIIVGVLNGGVLVLSDLIRYMDIDLEIDFIRISSYGDARESTGHIKILKPLSADIKGRSVVVVEDIVDSGLSIEFLRNMLEAFGPNKLKFATLLNKPSKNKIKAELDYIGFNIEDKYVVGYGLDDCQFKRNLRSIYVVE